MTRLTNIAKGPRGIWAGGAMVMLEPGETREVADIADAELAGIDEEAFRVEATRKAEDDDDDDGSELGALKVAELKALAEAEGVDLGEATRKADIVAAIVAAREAREEG